MINKRNTTYTRVTNIPEHLYQEAENRARNIPIYKKGYLHSKVGSWLIRGNTEKPLVVEKLNVRVCFVR